MDGGGASWVRRIPAALVVAAALALAGCGGGSNPADVAAVKTTVNRWLSALATGNGKAFCAVLSKHLLENEAEDARSLGDSLHWHVTCAQANSTHPPGITAKERAELSLARRQAAAGQRIESVTVTGDRATVHYSWLMPRHPSPVLSFNRPAHGDRIADVVTLHREHGRWVIG